LYHFFYTIAVCELGATGITFDDIPNENSAGGTIPSIYAGLSWINAQYLNATVYVGSGYVFVSASGDFVAWFNSVVTIQTLLANNTLTLNSMVTAAGWSNSISLTIAGYNSSTQLYTKTVALNTYTQTILVLNWIGLNKIVLTPSGSGYLDTGIDNLCITF
jgi:hypothetical protein